ncbi:peroxidasin homolog [Pagrus major]|uniref:peroxidasin homolog n=1 Tax=Pagrus major TaxID=143350 RepID=UPI003CC8B4AF
MKIIKVLTMEGRISTLTLLCLVLSGVGALQVNIPQEVYEHARGDNITLPCSFTPKAPLNGSKLVVISWSAEATQAGAQETLILTYYSPVAITDIKPLYEGRVSLDVDVAKGRANLKLSSITLADNKVFECRVQIPGDDEGKPADTARLVVLVAPSTPICKIQGKVEYGENINLTCVSEEGLPQPTYKWESRDFRNMPHVADPRTTDKGGILSLYQISRDTSGHYICMSANKIRSATCNITLSVDPPIAPSTPICKIQGKVEYGENINLTCVSEEGLPQPTYKWESRDFRNMPHVPNPRTTDKGGILSLYQISRDTSGHYTCTSSNKIRSATCNITLSVDPPIAPSTPICKIQGKVEYGQNINLTCVSEEGLPQPTYKWESRDFRNMPHVPNPRTTDKGGILSLYQISRDISGHYTCTSSNKIRSATCNITLSVDPPIAPSTPICKIQGKVEYGQNINLTCVSEKGSPQPTYKWESRDFKNMPHGADPRTTDKGGILSLYDISTDTSGYFICTSSNKIRSATCNITLSVMPPSKNTDPTAGIIGGVVAALIVLIIVICCCCKKNTS